MTATDLFEAEATAADPSLATTDASAGSATSPSFDCSKARSVAEQLICTDHTLATLDMEFAVLYKKVKDRAANPAEFRARAIQEWKLREKCQTRSCLIEWYAGRTSELSNHLVSQH